MMACWRRLRAWIEAHPLAAPLLAGALLRGVAALVAIGFHARDDYFHVLDPALRWAADPTFDWDATALPGAGIRSHLVPRAVWLILELCKHAGISEPEHVLRILYATAGAYSLLVVVAMYLAAHRLLDPRSATLATWLAAIHFAMPYAGTRLLIEAMAMPPLLFGVWLLTYASTRRLLLAGVFVGLACWFRFQVGVAAIGMAVPLALTGFREGRSRLALLRVMVFALGGALALAAQGLFDVWTTGEFLGPVIRNIQVNLAPSPGLSRSTPLAYVGLWLLLTVPPATVVLLPALVRAARHLPQVSWPFVLFVVVHSLIPHKEERFMLPVLPLFLLLLAAAPGALLTAQGLWWQRLASWWPATRTYVVGVHLVALIIASTAQSQANLRDAMRILRQDGQARAVVAMGPELQTYFLGRPDLPQRRTSKVDAVWLARTMADLQEHGITPNRFLGFAVDGSKISILLAAYGLSCDQPLAVDGWWLDRLIYHLNPRRNKRRSPVLIWKCEQPAVARL